MNQDLTNCDRQLEQIRSSVLALLQAFEKGTGAEVKIRLRNVDAVFTEIRKRGAQMKDLENSEEHQHEKIESLKRRIEKKDAFLDLLNKS
ncbi:hypothetical protein L596_026110 [Steinernema carpocapsae]|uniref:Mediator of RNA polymerase II transcription subunit 9 n=1 Tax=Steinernema carpocapsae TaxID=34508 RepID=A0A4U5M0D1_STECR|nr:hypothetical protein L596_026110 [Steinernema carpocapsae]